MAQRFNKQTFPVNVEGNFDFAKFHNLGYYDVARLLENRDWDAFAAKGVFPIDVMCAIHRLMRRVARPVHFERITDTVQQQEVRDLSGAMFRAREHLP